MNSHKNTDGNKIYRTLAPFCFAEAKIFMQYALTSDWAVLKIRPKYVYHREDYNFHTLKNI